MELNYSWDFKNMPLNTPPKRYERGERITFTDEHGNNVELEVVYHTKSGRRLRVRRVGE